MGFGSFGGTELIIALVIILLLFGAKRIPELARGLGSGMREFRRGTRGEVEEKSDQEKKDEALLAGEGKSESRSEDVSTGADRVEQKRS
jgi:sec-independent protein translocase protein TatA